MPTTTPTPTTPDEIVQPLGRHIANYVTVNPRHVNYSEETDEICTYQQSGDVSV